MNFQTLASVLNVIFNYSVSGGGGGGGHHGPL